MNIITIGNWTFEAKQELRQVFARKTKCFGDSYQASAVITIIDNTPKIELLINKYGDKFTRHDYRDFQAYFIQLGYSRVTFDRYKNGIKKEVEKHG